MIEQTLVVMLNNIKLHRAVFTWIFKVIYNCSGFALLRYMICFEKTQCYFVIQSEVEPKMWLALRCFPTLWVVSWICLGFWLVHCVLCPLWLTSQEWKWFYKSRTALSPGCTSSSSNSTVDFIRPHVYYLLAVTPWSTVASHYNRRWRKRVD